MLGSVEDIVPEGGLGTSTGEVKATGRNEAYVTVLHRVPAASGGPVGTQLWAPRGRARTETSVCSVRQCFPTCGAGRGCSSGFRVQFCSDAVVCPPVLADPMQGRCLVAAMLCCVPPGRRGL